MQIVDKQTGDVVSYSPGSVIESELINNIADRAVAKGVGIGRTANHVREDVRAAVYEAIMHLKAQIKPVLG